MKWRNRLAQVFSLGDEWTKMPLKVAPTRGREVQFRQCAILQYSKTLSLRSPEFEDENEAPREWRPKCCARVHLMKICVI
jgi:hypothetical protein